MAQKTAHKRDSLTSKNRGGLPSKKARGFSCFGSRPQKRTNQEISTAETYDLYYIDMAYSSDSVSEFSTSEHASLDETFMALDEDVEITELELSQPQFAAAGVESTQATTSTKFEIPWKMHPSSYTDPWCAHYTQVLEDILKTSTAPPSDATGAQARPPSTFDTGPWPDIAPQSLAPGKSDISDTIQTDLSTHMGGHVPSPDFPSSSGFHPPLNQGQK